MEQKNYNKKNRKRKIFSKKFFIFLILLILLLSVVLLSFYGWNKITGKAIDSIEKENFIQLKTSLNIPEIILKRVNYQEIDILVPRGSFILIEDKKISLDMNENRIVLKDFEGDFELNEYVIKILEGRVSEIIINNVPIESEKKGKIKISLSKSSSYNFFEINDEFYIRDLSFISSGQINVEKDSLNINSEKLKLTKYIGSLKIQNRKLILDGFVESLIIEGDARKIKFSK